MRVVIAILVLGACGGSPHTAPPPQQPKPVTPVANAKPANAPLEIAAVCRRLSELAAAKCGEFRDFQSTQQDCVEKLGPELADPSFEAFSECLMNPSCEEVGNCLKAAQQAADAAADGAGQKLRGCNDSAAGGEAVGIPRAEWERRNGVTARTFSQATSTKALPIEMCGIPAENRWLGSLSCDDGSRPISTSVDAEKFRGGNVGDGGRCNSIIDIYNVTCPEKTYPIFIDAYVCPLEQSE